METTNKFLVGVAGNNLVTILGTIPPVLKQEDALNLAAWLVALADPDGTKFPPLLESVQNT